MKRIMTLFFLINVFCLLISLYHNQILTWRFFYEKGTFLRLTGVFCDFYISFLKKHHLFVNFSSMQRFTQTNKWCFCLLFSCIFFLLYTFCTITFSVSYCNFLEFLPVKNHTTFVLSEKKNTIRQSYTIHHIQCNNHNRNPF